MTPKKFMWVPFLRSFPGNEAHKLFSGGPSWGVLGGVQKVWVDKVQVLFPSLNQRDLFRSGQTDPVQFKRGLKQGPVCLRKWGLEATLLLWGIGPLRLKSASKMGKFGS